LIVSIKGTLVFATCYYPGNFRLEVNLALVRYSRLPVYNPAWLIRAVVNTVKVQASHKQPALWKAVNFQLQSM